VLTTNSVTSHYTPSMDQLIFNVEELRWNLVSQQLSQLTLEEHDHPIVLWAQGKVIEIEEQKRPEARKLFEKAIHEAENRKDYLAQIRALDALGHSYCRDNLPVTGTEFLNKALDLVHLNRVTGRIKISLLVNIGMSCLRLQEYHSAIRYFREVEQLQKVLKSEYKKESVLFGLGVAYSFLEKFEEGKYYSLLSLELYEEKKNDPAAIAATYGNLAILHRNTGHYEDALHYFEKCNQLFSEINSRFGVENNLVEWAVLHIKMGNLKKAKEMLEAIYSDGLNYTKFEAGFHLAKIYVQENNPAKAREYLESVETVVDLERKKIAQLYTLIGRQFKEQGDLDSAFVMYEKSTTMMLDKR
jgi:HTH-type transcriptional regulator, quorum sensing regulator NprR